MGVKKLRMLFLLIDYLVFSRLELEAVVDSEATFLVFLEAPLAEDFLVFYLGEQGKISSVLRLMEEGD